MSGVNINYHFDAFERASEIMSKSVAALEKKTARQQIAAMAMQGILSNGSVIVQSLTDKDKKDLVREACSIADALIAELKKKEQ